MERKPWIFSCTFVGALILTCTTVSAQCVVDISTGYDQGAGAVLAEGVADDDYTVGGNPVFTGGTAQGFPVGAWVPNDAASLWVSNTANANNEVGTYVYSITVNGTGGAVARLAGV